MNTLFDISPILPEGFTYHPDFITDTEETALLNSISEIELATMKFHQYEAKRKVLSFGSGWSFTEQQLNEGNPIPGEFNFLVERIADHLKIPIASIAQFLITEYPVGSVINWHRDAPPFKTIVGVSLLSDCFLKLRPHDKEKQSRAATIPLAVQRRSCYVMSGESKTAWQHCTVPLENVRFSLTFRTLQNF